jgi:hypothetical protein
MPQLLYPWEKNPDTHLIGGCMGPRDSLDPLEERKICCTCWDSKHVSSVVCYEMKRLKI